MSFPSLRARDARRMATRDMETPPDEEAPLLLRIDRCQEEIAVLEALHDAAQDCLLALVRSNQGSDVRPRLWGQETGGRGASLHVRVVGALGESAELVKGMDIRVELSHRASSADEVAFGNLGTAWTTLVPTRNWRSAVAGGAGIVQVVWDQLLELPSSEGGSPAPLNVAVVCEDGTRLAATELPLGSLGDQRSQERWCYIGDGWRVLLFCQYVRSPVMLLESHISDFQTRLQGANAAMQLCLTHLQELRSANQVLGTKASTTTSWIYQPERGMPQLPIGIRTKPDVNAQKTKYEIYPGTVFGVSEERNGADGVLYLRLGNGHGWLFDKLPREGVMCVRAQGGSFA